MSRIGNGNVACWLQPRTKAGNKSAIVCLKNLLIQALQKDSGAKIFDRERANGADRESARHRGLKALSAHVANDDEERTVLLRKNLIEVSANLLSREIGCLDLIAREGRKRRRYKALLDLSRSAEFCCRAGPFPADAREAEEDDHSDGKQEEEISQIDRLHRNRSELDRVVEEIEAMPPVEDRDGADVIKRKRCCWKQAGQDEPSRFAIAVPIPDGEQYRHEDSHRDKDDGLNENVDSAREVTRPREPDQ